MFDASFWYFYRRGIGMARAVFPVNIAIAPVDMMSQRGWRAQSSPPVYVP
jgi:hypothetical protein